MIFTFTPFTKIYIPFLIETHSQPLNLTFREFPIMFHSCWPAVSSDSMVFAIQKFSTVKFTVRPPKYPPTMWKIINFFTLISVTVWKIIDLIIFLDTFEILVDFRIDFVLIFLWQGLENSLFSQFIFVTFFFLDFNRLFQLGFLKNLSIV